MSQFIVTYFYPGDLFKKPGLEKSSMRAYSFAHAIAIMESIGYPAESIFAIERKEQ